MKKYPRIENWSVVFGNDNPYLPPEAQSIVIRGMIYGHENQDKWPDSKPIRTSRIIGKKEGRICTYSGSEYELGEIDSEYVKHCIDNGYAEPTKESVLEKIPEVK